ncbi:Homeodomain-like DNA binding domain-containing transcription factor [Phycomyces blakesleeanus NRRL 1555(-)]|uniref:Homeodomain-like DNA binding domain-containing transcription factor n=1 Tax=Phycomyces blakesleeanus (strain ATCC 8743b / DSM 1359 / FGSC 10004 / NBRC 33097 / NRRL 1555) TaxID=763407 RepID=A0A162WUQ1_PHYB8|nr:Homeodomain-like DNA binding domain-containing transcription factor [Phycomyces blakesleeanus NRRL 1555(-)]OAD71005.1 Homeodomain-like DNA binding domain-containing transcription factor [Phycomyces blakesleeanus NRRL 1555(-)]|eukprot:XP_018289045.1 Homeodomain-like DNA binding domain-containing transcription factor [Phycomyces blakesleeanus NRRL 1555(-)]
MKCVLKSYKKTGSHKATVQLGRPPKLDKRDKREILLEISQDPTHPLTKISKNLITPVSDNALRKFLCSVGIYSLKMICKPKALKSNQKQLQCISVIWSDESRFQLYKNDGRIRVLKKNRSGFKSSFVSPTMKFGGGAIMERVLEF